MANQVEQQFYLTLFTNSTGVLTKELKMQHGKIVSEAPKMVTGTAQKVQLTLSQLPDFIKSLKPNQCFTPGVMDTEHEFVEVLTSKEFERRGYEYPVHVDATGVYGTRSSKSMVNKGPSLILFDYDKDEHAKISIKGPDEFLKYLSEAVPELELNNTDYIRTYSTSTSLFDRATDKVIRPADGFHIYMLVDKGEDIARFGKMLEKRCWMAGMGHIKVSASGGRLPRTIFDTSVFQPERLCFEAGAFIRPSESFYQKLPKGEINRRGHRTVSTKKLKDYTPTQDKEFRRVVEMEKQSETVIARVSEFREIQVQRIVNTTHYTQKPLSRGEAEKIVKAHENKILHPADRLEFEDGRVTTVLEAFLNPVLYDGAQLQDPLRPDKGFSKAKFYANAGRYGDYNPTIHSFVEGERNFELRESLEMFMSKSEETESKLEEYDDKALIVNQRYLPELRLRSGVTLVKSEKGTGKTYMLKQQVQQYEGRVLAVSQLISLVNSLSKQFNLADYNEIENEQLHTLRMQKRLGICLNSIYKLQGQTYDIVIMDEVCQLIRAIKASTVDKPAACLKVLREIIAGAKYIVCMDADLNKDFVELMRDRDFGILPFDIPINVIINKYRPAKEQNRKVTLYQDTDGKGDTASFVEALVNEAKVSGLFYASNSKVDVLKKAATIIEELGGDGGIEQEHFITEVNGRRIITITSNNSQTADVQTFIRDLNNNLRDEDIFMSSPSMGTGHSIDATEMGARFNKTFAFFTKMAGNLPSDCLQHMSRVRECRDYHIMYLDNARRYPTSPLEIVQKEIYGSRNTIDNKLCVQFISEYDYATERLKINDHGWSDWYGQLKSFENNKLNHFSKNLIEALTHEGYTIDTLYTLATDDGYNLKMLMEELKDQIKEVERQKLREAELLTDEEFELLDNQTLKSAEDQRLLLKKRQSRLFGLPAGDELNDVVTMSTQALNARRRGLLLGANNDDLFLIDMLNRFDKKRADKDKTAFADHQGLGRGFLFHFGVTFVSDIPHYDGREINAIAKAQAFDFLLANKRDLEILHGVRMPLCDTDKKREDFVRRVLTSFGLKYRREKFRTGTQTAYRYYLDEERLGRWVDDVVRAKEFSSSTMYTGLEEVPGNLKAYVFQALAGSPQVSELYPYISKLHPVVQNRLVTLLNNKIFNLTANVA